MRFFLELSYNGRNYRGWQIQPKANTVQAEINNALSTILSEEIKTIGCGRTDTGVHARQFFLHFDTERSIPQNLIHKLNKFLPNDIAIKKLMPVKDDTHSRFDATERTYTYYVHFEKDPFRQNSSYYWPHTEPDLKKMNEAAKVLLDYREFKPLSKSGSSPKTYICHLMSSKWYIQKSPDGIFYKVTSDRFLRGMVRMIVGVLLMIGTKKLTISDLKQTLNAQTRFKYIIPVPPHGLYLTSVNYPYL